MSTAEIRKAAVLLGSLSAVEAAPILAQLEQAQIEAVIREIVAHDEVPQEARRSIICELQSASAREGRASASAIASDPIASARVASAASETRPLESMPFAFVPHADSRNLLRALADEHPQTIALVLSHISSAESAKILSGLNSELARAVTARLATIGPTSPEVVADVDAGLRRRVSRLERR